MPRNLPEIHFASEGIRFRLRNKSELESWLVSLARSHKRKIHVLYYIFVSDEQLLQMNKKFLRHNTYTDIITFDLSNEGKNSPIQGEIYISAERVAENAAKFKVTKTEELHRVMAHGLLHLCGFGDKTPAQAKRMRREEEKALVLRKF